MVMMESMVDNMEMMVKVDSNDRVYMLEKINQVRTKMARIGLNWPNPQSASIRLDWP